VAKKNDIGGKPWGSFAKSSQRLRGSTVEADSWSLRVAYAKFTFTCKRVLGLLQGNIYKVNIF
jgi:hypothetical protein